MITKVRKSGDTIRITRVAQNPNHKDKTDEFNLRSEDPPRPEFNDALQGLKPHVLEILQLPKDYGESMTVLGVSISEKSGIRKIVISAKKELLESNSTFNISTPSKPDRVTGEDSEGEDVLSDKAIAAIDVLLDEAAKYLDGDRLQANLDLEGE